MPSGVRIAIVPGNGGGNVRGANFYGWAEKALARCATINWTYYSCPL